MINNSIIQTKRDKKKIGTEVFAFKVGELVVLVVELDVDVLVCFD